MRKGRWGKCDRDRYSVRRPMPFSSKPPGQGPPSHSFPHGAGHSVIAECRADLRRLLMESIMLVYGYKHHTFVWMTTNDMYTVNSTLLNKLYKFLEYGGRQGGVFEYPGGVTRWR